MIIRRDEPQDIERIVPDVKVSVNINEAMGVLFLGVTALLLVVVLAVVVIRLSGRRSD